MRQKVVSQIEVSQRRSARYTACWGAALGMFAQAGCYSEHEPSEPESSSGPELALDAASAPPMDVSSPPITRATGSSSVPASDPSAPPTSSSSVASDTPSSDAGSAGLPSQAPASPPRATGAAAPKVCSQLAPAAATCQLGAGVSLPEDLTIDMLGTTRYYANGAILPSGRYRVAYVDGCLNSNLPGTTTGLLGAGNWTVHPTAVDVAGIGTTVPDNACWLVGEGKVPVKITPGTANISAGARPRPIGVFDTYAECVAANCKQAPEEFFFGGGKLGLRIGSSLGVPLVSGETVGGRAPTFRISRVDPCP